MSRTVTPAWGHQEGPSPMRVARGRVEAYSSASSSMFETGRSVAAATCSRLTESSSRRYSSKPSVWSRTKAWSTASRSTSSLPMPRASQGSLPGRRAWWRWALRAVAQRTGSMTCMGAPARRASVTNAMAWGRVTSMFLPQTTTAFALARSWGAWAPSPPKSSSWAAKAASTLSPPSTTVGPPKWAQKSLPSAMATSPLMPE